MQLSLRTPIRSGWSASCWALFWVSASLAQTDVDGEEGADVRPLETRVQGARSLRQKPGDALETSPDWTASSQPEDLLEALAGISLARHGGPMAPVGFSMRGLSGPRTQISLGDLTLDDPATGGFDAAHLPLFLSLRLVEAASDGLQGAPGSRLHLQPLPTDSSSVQAQLGWGSMQTLRAQLGAQFTTRDDGMYLAALQIGRTDGNFSFQPLSPSTSVPAPATQRVNNDQQRASLYLSGDQRLGTAQLGWSAFGALHEGGIPGFATSPTAGLRGENGLVGSQVQLTLPLRAARLSLQTALRLSSMGVYSPVTGQEERLSSSSAAVRGDIRLPSLHGDAFRLDSSLRVSTEQSRVLGSTFARQGSRTAADVSLHWPRLKLRLWSFVSGAYFTDVGWLPEASIGAEFSPFRHLQTGLQLVQSGRAPTLDELYAPRGLVLGNPKLQIESGFEGEAYIRLLRNRVFDGRMGLFAGRMNNAIVFLNRNAFEILPINTGPLLRGGLVGRAQLRPHPWFEMRLSATKIWTWLEVTEAPLPSIPPLFARLEHRWGPAEGVHLSWAMRFRGKTFSSLHGTLPVAAYLMWDGLLRIPLLSDWFVSLSITNLTDLQTAQDVNLLPLPGRQFFCSLEYRHAAIP